MPYLPWTVMPHLLAHPLSKKELRNFEKHALDESMSVYHILWRKQVVEEKARQLYSRRKTSEELSIPGYD